jgi:type IX secretion system PorP/SprF family membrane protein
MKKSKVIIALSAFLVSLNFFGQQDPQYTQYMYNMHIINPAYAGSKETLSIGVLGRIQWVNIEGAPKTYTLSAHAPFGKNVGLGISVIADKIGPVKEQNIYADFSYTLKTSEEGNLAFGLKGGFTLHNLDALSLTTIDPETQSNLDLQNKTLPNIGAGVFYYTHKFYAGLSLPNILETKHFENKNGIIEASENAHYFLTGGYVFDLSENLKFKPSTMVKATSGTPLSVDLSANFLLNDKLELGASYRLGDAISALINFSVTKDFRVGYAYDYTTSNLGNFNSGSHEVFLLWDLDFSRDNVVSPRFF